MKASLRLESIGDDAYGQSRLARATLTATGLEGLAGYFAIPRRCWVAEITGLSDRYGFERTFLRAKVDYTHANSAGSRGVFLFYLLESGHIYGVKAPTSWQRSDRYFCTVTDDGAIVRLNEEEVRQWLRNK